MLPLRPRRQVPQWPGSPVGKGAPAQHLADEAAAFRGGPVSGVGCGAQAPGAHRPRGSASPQPASRGCRRPCTSPRGAGRGPAGRARGSATACGATRRTRPPCARGPWRSTCACRYSPMASISSRSTALLRHVPTRADVFCAPSISPGFTNAAPGRGRPPIHSPPADHRAWMCGSWRPPPPPPWLDLLVGRYPFPEAMPQGREGSSWTRAHVPSATG